MTEPSTTHESVEQPDMTPLDVEAVDTLLIDDELLVEDVSIDGMCGVY